MEPPESPSTSHDRNPTGRFSDRADDYRRYRPSYPSAAIDAVLNGVRGAGGTSIAWRAADVGAGTGISARLLADRGVKVIAIEPNEQMRRQAEPHPNIQWQAGTAEATGLATGSVDIVLCAQAYHWFEPAVTLPEFHRILAPHGRLALIWNDRDERDGFTREYSDLLRIASNNDPTMNDHTSPRGLYESTLFSGVREERFENDQHLDLQGLVGRVFSSSYIPKDGPRAETLRVHLQQLFEQRAAGGIVRLMYVTRVFLAERAS